MALIEGRAVDRLPFMPITMMFAADRIGRNYRDYAFDFRTLVEGQIRTAEEFGFDHVSAISDPSREAADCGSALDVFDDQPPAASAAALLADKSDLARLKAPDPLGGGRMLDRVRAVELFRERVAGERVVEGWVEGPCASAANLRNLQRLMLDFFDDPEFVRDLFEFTLDLGIRFAAAQVEAGADLIGVGDAAASLVGPRIYEELVWPYEKRLVDRVHEMGAHVRLHICGNASDLLPAIGRLGCDIVDLDSMVSIAAARAAMPEQILLGNADPVQVIRDGNPASIVRTLAACHAEAGSRWIVGAGCEIPRDTPVENLLATRDFARDAGLARR